MCTVACIVYGFIVYSLCAVARRGKGDGFVDGWSRCVIVVIITGIILVIVIKMFVIGLRLLCPQYYRHHHSHHHPEHAGVQYQKMANQMW